MYVNLPECLDRRNIFASYFQRRSIPSCHIQNSRENLRDFHCRSPRTSSLALLRRPTRQERMVEFHENSLERQPIFFRISFQQACTAVYEETSGIFQTSTEKTKVGIYTNTPADLGCNHCLSASRGLLPSCVTSRARAI